MNGANPGVPEAPAPVPEPQPGFEVSHQSLELEVDFYAQRLKGRTVITLNPQSKDLKTIKLNARQCRLTRLNINNKGPTLTYKDLYNSGGLALHSQAGVHQHHLLSNKLEGALAVPPEEELILHLPKSIKIEEVSVTSVTQSSGTVQVAHISSADAETLESTKAIADASVAKFTQLTVVIEFIHDKIRDGFQFVTPRMGNGHYPHAYTRTAPGPGSACALFPCVDALNKRCTWEISIKCPRTVEAALRQPSPDVALEKLTLSHKPPPSARTAQDEREMVVLCSGEMTDEIIDKSDPTQKTVSFAVLSSVSAQQIGFAIGPFEHVNLSELRGTKEDGDLGQNAVEIHGYCLPGRTKELRNTCLPTTKAMDFIVRKYVACPYRTYTMCFVEDLSNDTSVSACLALCSSRLLYPEGIIDPSEDVTRKLVLAIASQWVGIDIVPQAPTDTWVIVGMAQFITEAFMKELCGNNEYRYRMKQRADLVCNLDRDRPSVFDLGALLHVDPTELDFMAMKALLVLFILDRRIAKVVGLPKMPAIISKILLRARKSELLHNALSTDTFQRTCERFSHSKLDDFLNQWVRGAGCPKFRAFQRFNRKKLVVEMMIQQVQVDLQGDRDLDIGLFMREVREDFHNIYASPVQSVFTGPMTIRIHEADGTPYEHIVEIKDAVTKFDIPYNTKYKRLKRSKKQRERNAAAVGAEASEMESDTLLYCLGDVLQTESEVRDWKLTEWSAEDEERMNSESYEWIRLDADFEWICRIQLAMPGYMFVSQLQQDRDIAAQLESIQHMNSYPANPLISSILLRTMMDRRYFHGIRTSAAKGIVKHAKAELEYIGLFHLRKAFEEIFCLPELNSRMTRPNDFSNRTNYYLLCVIIEGISKVRDDKGVAPRTVKEFLLDKLKFNDNSINKFSDCYYVATLMRSICDAMSVKPSSMPEPDAMDIDEADEANSLRRLEQEFLAELDRHRRMDEWTSSFQNIYSRTTLDCKLRLAQAQIGEANAMHFLQYTRPGNFDMLRLTAFENLVRSGIFDHGNLLRYFFYCLSSDPSPWVRDSLRNLFGKALATKAIGDNAVITAPAPDELIIEQDPGAEVRRTEIARKQTIEGATEALRSELQDNEILQTSLWSAVCAPGIGLKEIQSLLEYCRMLYDPITEMKVTLRYPHYWKVQHVGKGLLKFSQVDKIRTKSIQKHKPPVISMSQTITSGSRSNDTKASAPASQKLTFKNPKPAAKVSATPPVPVPVPERKQTFKIKLKLSRPATSIPPPSV